MIKPYTEEEYTDALKSRCQLKGEQHHIDLEQLREFCFDPRLTEEQYQRVMGFVRTGDAALERYDPNGGVQHFEGGWKYERIHY